MASLPACATPPKPLPHGSSVTLVCGATKQPETVVATRFYRAKPDDIDWTIAGTIPTTGEASLVIPNTFYGEQFYAVYLDAAGNQSDPSDTATNTVSFAPPGQIKIKL